MAVAVLREKRRRGRSTGSGGGDVKGRGRELWCSAAQLQPTQLVPRGGSVGGLRVDARRLGGGRRQPHYISPQLYLHSSANAEGCCA